MQLIEMNSTTLLSVFMCTLIDVPDSGKDCSVDNPDICTKCNLRGGYLSGESTQAIDSAGHVISILLWLITMIVGLLGLAGNYLIITIVNRRNSERSFDILLMTLAAFDTFCSFITTIGTTVTILCFQNWISKGEVFMYFYYLSFSTVLFGRSASVFTTVLITIQSYLMIAFPVASLQWFTARATKILSVLVLIFAICLAIPRYSSMYIGPNPYQNETFTVSRLQEFRYLIKPTAMHRFWYHTLNRAHMQIDFWAPLPLLVLFKFLSFWNVRKLNKKRKELNLNQKKQIQAVKMFLPVVVVLFICNIGPMAFYSLMEIYGIVYREMYLVVCLSTALNSSVNFLIYYFRSANFRVEADTVITQLFGSNKHDAIVRTKNVVDELESNTTNTNNKRNSGSSLWYY